MKCNLLLLLLLLLLLRRFLDLVSHFFLNIQLMHGTSTTRGNPMRPKRASLVQGELVMEGGVVGMEVAEGVAAKEAMGNAAGDMFPFG